MKRHTHLFLLLLIGTLAGSLLTACPDESGPSYALGMAGISTPVYQNGPFSITLNVFDPDDYAPKQVSKDLAITVTAPEGVGLGGTTTMIVPKNTSTVTFADLVLDTTGQIDLTFDASNTYTLTVSVTVNVPYDLVFQSVPASVMAPGTFNAVIEVRDINTGNLLTPLSPLDITIGTTGTGTVGGPATQSVTTDTYAFTGLTYDAAETASLTVSAAGVPGGSESDPIEFDAPFVNIVGTNPISPQVGQFFSVMLEITSTLAPAGPISLPGDIDVALSQTSGAGTLVGTLSTTTSGPTFEFTDLLYNDIDTVGLHIETAYGTDDTMIPMDYPLIAVGMSSPNPAVVNEPFSLPIALTSARNPGQPLTLGTPLTFVLAKVSGAGNLTGAFSINTTGPTASFSGLRYSQNDTVSMTVSCQYSTAQRSIVMDYPLAEIVAISPADPLVNEPMTVDVSIVSAASGNPLTLSSPIGISLSVAAGVGSLAGTLSANVNGPTYQFTGVAYDGWDTLTAQLDGPWGQDTADATFEVSLTGPASASALPNTPFPPFDMVFEDFNEDAFAVTTTVDWEVEETATGTSIQTGSETVTATSDFQIQISPIAGYGAYELTATVPGHATVEHVIQVTTVSIVNEPGPTAMLSPARVNTTYFDDLANFTPSANQFVIYNGSLPPGLTLDPQSGEITGTPTTADVYEFLALGIDGTDGTPIRCVLPIFSATESEWVNGQDLSGLGPYSVAQTQDSFTYTSNYNGASIPTQLYVYYPTNIAGMGTLPVYVHHRGRGFNYDEYHTLLGRIASHGFICASVDDYYSFVGSGGGSPGPYEYSYAEQGMQSASAAQQATMNRLIDRGRTSGDALYQHVNEDRLFIGGHSRGGGATHGSHVRGLDLIVPGTLPHIPADEHQGLAGVIYFMAFDLWYFSSCQPPSTPAGPSPNAYSIPKWLNHIPSLIISAEDDGDLTYPYTDQLVERAQRAMTYITIWGANHNYTGDAHYSDGSPSITRAEQHNILAQWCNAFLLRYGYDQVDLEGHLFGPEYGTSSQVGHVSRRFMPTEILVDDCQNGNPGTNTLGFTNTMSGGNVSLADPYPARGALPAATPRGARITFSSSSATYTANLASVGGSLDASECRRLIFETQQNSSQGYNWATIQVRLTDNTGATSTVTVFDRSGPSSNYLPVYPVPGHTSPRWLDRMLQVDVLLSQFTGVNTGALTKVEWLFSFSGTPGNYIQLDDIRFE